MLMAVKVGEYVNEVRLGGILGATFTVPKSKNPSERSLGFKYKMR